MKKLVCLSLATLGLAFTFDNVCTMDAPQNELAEAQSARDSKLKSFPVTVLQLRAANRVKDTLARGHLDNALTMINNSAERGFVVDRAAYDKWKAEFKELQDKFVLAQGKAIEETMLQISSEEVKQQESESSASGVVMSELPGGGVQFTGNGTAVVASLNRPGIHMENVQIIVGKSKEQAASEKTPVEKEARVGSDDETQPISQPEENLSRQVLNSDLEGGELSTLRKKRRK